MLKDESLKAQVRAVYGRLSTGLSGFKPRYGQREMIAGIANTLSRARMDKDEEVQGQNILVVEGKTGVGKTVGYLVPAIVMARAMGKKLIVSTGTVSLQEQLFTRDLPAVAKFFDDKLSFALSKGRRRYLCPSRLFQVTGDAGQDGLFATEEPVWDRKPEEQEIKFLSNMVKRFEDKTWRGDRDEYPETVAADLWTRISTDSTGCPGRRCSLVSECPYYKARATMNGADVIVANHDLVLSCLASESNLLPSPDEAFFVFDEAHHLPDVAVSRFAEQAPVIASERWLERLPGFAGRVLSAIPAERRVDGIGEPVHGLADKLKELGAALSRSPIFAAGAIHRFRHGELDPEMLVIAGEIASLCQVAFRKVAELKAEFDAAIEEGEIGTTTAESLLRDFGPYMAKMDALNNVWSLMIKERDEGAPPLAKWIENWGDGKDFIVHASPISAAGVLRRHLWTKASAVVLTSATITTLGEFKFFLKKTGLSALPKVTTLSVQSPFDYARQGELSLPKMLSDPKDVEGHTAEIGSLLPSHLEQWVHGSLVLFASRRQMEAVYSQLPEKLKTDVLLQGTMPRGDLITTHSRRVTAGHRSVLFGLAGLGEGLDLPGQLCEHVIIAKIPFPPPDSPLEEALAEWIERNRGNPFVELTLPKAGLVLVQWVGRLVRTEEDRGRITILDRRVSTKAYGARLLGGLPTFSRV